VWIQLLGLEFSRHLPTLCAALGIAQDSLGLPDFKVWTDRHRAPPHTRGIAPPCS
jgi:hypothetical protein